MSPRLQLPRAATPVALLPRRGPSNRPLPSRASKLVPRAAADNETSSDRSVEKPFGGKTFLLSLFAAGATLGPPLDGIHGAFNLLQYDLAPVEIGDSHSAALHTSLAVPLLLGTFYAVSGLLHVWGDEFFAPSLVLRPLPLPPPRQGPALAACAFALVTAHLALSALLYNARIPANHIFLALFPSAFLIWLSLDRTATGVALALATAAAAPLAELLLMNLFGVWHYPKADFFLSSLGDEKGIFSWVPACYAAYSLWIGALARWWVASGGGGRGRRGGREGEEYKKMAAAVAAA